MKILAENSDAFILEASKEEVANLVGYYSRFSKKLPKVGSIIQVSAMYSQLYNLSSLANELKKTRDRLRSMAADLELVNPLKSNIEIPEDD
jgi:hypothetical protein